MPTADTTIRTTCPYCGVGCGVAVTNGVLKGDAAHPANFGRLCSKGAALGETLALPDRLTRPILYGEESDWNTALDVIAREFARIIAKDGPEAISFYVSGQFLTEDYYVANKLMKGFIGAANIDTNSRLCMSSSVAGHVRAFGEDIVPGCYEPRDAKLPATNPREFQREFLWVFENMARLNEQNPWVSRLLLILTLESHKISPRVLREIRKANQRRVRQPLSHLVVASPDAHALAPFVDIIADEVNVKEVGLTDDVAEYRRSLDLTTAVTTTTFVARAEPKRTVDPARNTWPVMVTEVPPAAGPVTASKTRSSSSRSTISRFSRVKNMPSSS